MPKARTVKQLQIQKSQAGQEAVQPQSKEQQHAARQILLQPHSRLELPDCRKAAASGRKPIP